MPRLSIIIPYLSADDPLEDTLVSVLQNRPADCEVIVVHRGPYDDPYNLGDEVTFIGVDRDSAVADCLNSANQAARGDVVHFLGCGCEVEDGWTEAALAHFDHPRVAMISPLVVDAQEQQCVVTAGVRMALDGSRRDCCAGKDLTLRTTLLARPAGPSRLAGFYRRQVVAACGGFSAEVSEHYLDLDLALSIRSLRFVCKFAPDCVVRTGQSSDLDHTSISRGRNAQRLAWRHASSNGWIKTIVAHPLAVAVGVAAGCFRPATWLRLLGRAAACGEIGRFIRHQRRLDQARATLNGDPPMTVALTRTPRADVFAESREQPALKRSA